MKMNTYVIHMAGLIGEKPVVEGVNVVAGNLINAIYVSHMTRHGQCGYRPLPIRSLLVNVPNMIMRTVDIITGKRF